MASLHLDLETIESGVSLNALNNFVTVSGMQFRDIYEVVIPARTLKHRKGPQGTPHRRRVGQTGADDPYFRPTAGVFGDKEKALHWLNEPKRRFEGRTPMQMLRTELGGRMVEEMPGQNGLNTTRGW